MGFKISFKEEDAGQSFTIIEEGKYEATIVSAEDNEWNDAYSIKFGVEIRSDVQQKHQGGKILFNDIYVSPGMPEYEETRIKKVAAFMKATGQNPNVEIELKDLCRDIIGKNVLVYVKHKNDKEGKAWPRVTFVAPSAVAGNQVSNNVRNNKSPVNVQQEDLPF